MTTDTFLVTCEHGGNRIPTPYRPLFRGQQALLESHRGHDPGALVMARTLAKSFGASLVASTVSRLLVDLNRSIGHPRLYSSATRRVPPVLRGRIIGEHYVPYRTRVERLVEDAVAGRRRVVHISSHSFTPVLDGDVRRADVGLLYDPRRKGEVELSARWKQALAALAPALRVRRNYPYAGKGDGLTAHLRRRFPATAYVGIELEINQRIVHAGGRPWGELRRALVASLRQACTASASATERGAPDGAATITSTRAAARPARLA